MVMHKKSAYFSLYRTSKHRGKYSNPMDYEISPPISPVKCTTPSSSAGMHMCTPGSV